MRQLHRRRQALAERHAEYAAGPCAGSVAEKRGHMWCIACIATYARPRVSRLSRGYTGWM